MREAELATGTTHNTQKNNSNNSPDKLLLGRNGQRCPLQLAPEPADPFTVWVITVIGSQITETLQLLKGHEPHVAETL